MKKTIQVITLLFVGLFCKAQLQNYSYYRELNPVNESAYYDLNIPSSVLDRPGNYRVYEINSKDTLEVPYLSDYYYNSNQSSYLRGLKIIDKTYESGKHSYATLIVDTDLIYNCVYLNFSSSSFFKDVTLEGSDDNKKWKTIVENEKIFHYYREPGDHYFRNKIVFEPVSYNYLRIRLNDVMTPKIELASAFLPLEKEIKKEDKESILLTSVRTEDKKNKQTIIEGSFARKFFVNCLKINASNPDNFCRNVSIYLATVNASGKDHWIRFGEGTIRSDRNDLLYLDHYNSGDEAFHSQKLRIVIDNLDNRPLEKIDVEAFTNFETIKLKLEKDKKYVLAYGNDKDAIPQYDLAHFKNSIPLNLKLAGLLIEKQIEHAPIVKPEPLIKNKVWIWAALIISMLVIGIFAVNLLKKSS